MVCGVFGEAVWCFLLKTIQTETYLSALVEISTRAYLSALVEISTRAV